MEALKARREYEQEASVVEEINAALELKPRD